MSISLLDAIAASGCESVFFAGDMNWIPTDGEWGCLTIQYYTILNYTIEYTVALFNMYCKHKVPTIEVKKKNAYCTVLPAHFKELHHRYMYVLPFSSFR